MARLHFTRADKRLRPVAFDLHDDIGRGLYVDEMGNHLTGEMIKREVAKPGRKIVRVTFRVRYRSEPPDAPTHKQTALAIVNGAISQEQLERIVYRLARDQYAPEPDDSG